MNYVQRIDESSQRLTVGLGSRTGAEAIQTDAGSRILEPYEIRRDQGGLPCFVHYLKQPVLGIVFSQYSQAERMYCAHIHVPERRLVGKGLLKASADTVFQSFRRVFRERERDDGGPLRAFLDQARDAARESLRLAAARAGENEEVAVVVIDRLAFARRWATASTALLECGAKGWRECMNERERNCVADLLSNDLEFSREPVSSGECLQ